MGDRESRYTQLSIDAHLSQPIMTRESLDTL